MINCTGGSDGKESACNAGDPGSITRSARLPREGNGNPLQYSCLKNSMDRGYSPWSLCGMVPEAAFNGKFGGFQGLGCFCPFLSS